MTDAPDTPPIWECPECGGFIDSYGLGDEIIATVDRYTVQRVGCEGCDFERVTVTWGGSDGYEVWGGVYTLADPYDDANGEMLHSYPDGRRSYWEDGDADEAVYDLLVRHGRDSE